MVEGTRGELREDKSALIHSNRLESLLWRNSLEDMRTDRQTGTHTVGHQTNSQHTTHNGSSNWTHRHTVGHQTNSQHTTHNGSSNGTHRHTVGHQTDSEHTTYNGSSKGTPSSINFFRKPLVDRFIVAVMSASPPMPPARNSAVNSRPHT